MTSPSYQRLRRALVVLPRFVLSAPRTFLLVGFPARPPWDQLSASQALAVEDKSPLGV